MNNFIDLPQLKQQTAGQWQYILTALGVPSETLTNKHKPCPCCGGKDRFRFDDKNGTGSFICNQMDDIGGDGFAFVMHWLDSDFKTAFKAINEALNGVSTKDAPIPIKQHQEPKTPIKDDLERLSQIWNKAKPITANDAVRTYLNNRGLNAGALAFNPDSIRYHSALPYYYFDAKQKPVLLGYFDAMVCKITNSLGEFVGLHQTYLKDGYKLTSQHPETREHLPCKKMRSRFAGSLKGASIQLYPVANQTLAITEGIETALAVHQMARLPVHACLSANGIKSFVIPSDVKALFIYADNDKPCIDAVNKLKLKAIRHGIEPRIWLSKTDIKGFDALDALVASKNLRGAN